LLDLEGNEAVLGKRTGKDSSHGKLTYPALLGTKESRQRAERLIEEAIGAVETLGSSASPLESMARYVLGRHS